MDRVSRLPDLTGLATHGEDGRKQGMDKNTWQAARDPQHVGLSPGMHVSEDNCLMYNKE